MRLLPGIPPVLALVLACGCSKIAPVGPAARGEARAVVSLRLSDGPEAQGLLPVTADGFVQVLVRVVTQAPDGSFHTALVRTVDLPPDNLTFPLFLPLGHQVVVAAQINDGPLDPKYLGAVGIDLSQSLSSLDQELLLGSLKRDCYEFVGPNWSNFLYSFRDDQAVMGVSIVGPNWDLAFSAGVSTNTHVFSDGGSTGSQRPVVAYLGNGPMVEFPIVPPDSWFQVDSQRAKGGAEAVPGDVFCVRLTTMPGHAWIQILDPGQYNNNGPRFRFRVNRFQPFPAYDRTSADMGVTVCGSNPW